MDQNHINQKNRAYRWDRGSACGRFYLQEGLSEQRRRRVEVLSELRTQTRPGFNNTNRTRSRPEPLGSDLTLCNSHNEVWSAPQNSGFLCSGSYFSELCPARKRSKHQNMRPSGPEPSSGSEHQNIIRTRTVQRF